MSLVTCYLLTRRLTRRRRVISITQPRLNLNHDESSFLYLARLLDLSWHSTVKALQFLIRSPQVMTHHGPATQSGLLKVKRERRLFELNGLVEVTYDEDS